MLPLGSATATSLVLGATFLATGGGFPLDEKIKAINKPINQNIRIINADELAPDDFCCAISGIGSAGNTRNLNIAPFLKIGIERMEQTVNGKIKAIIPGEIGIENIIMEIAGQLELPIFDGDTAGRRAVPEMTQDTFFIAGESILPVILVNLDGEVKVIDKPTSDYAVESLARDFANQSQSKTALLFSHARPVSLIKKIISLGSLTSAIKIGEALQTKNKVAIAEALKTLVNGELITTGNVIKSIIEQGDGFLIKKVAVRTPEAILILKIKNEILALTRGDKIIVSIPDSICLLDQQTLMPIHSSDINEGQQIMIFKLPAISQWQTKKGLELFGLDYLNYVFKL